MSNYIRQVIVSMLQHAIKGPQDRKCCAAAAGLWGTRASVWLNMPKFASATIKEKLGDCGMVAYRFLLFPGAQGELSVAAFAYLDVVRFAFVCDAQRVRITFIPSSAHSN